MSLSRIFLPREIMLEANVLRKQENNLRKGSNVRKQKLQNADIKLQPCLSHMHIPICLTYGSYNHPVLTPEH